MCWARGTRKGACMCASSQPVRGLSACDLWPRDSNLSSLPVQYCYNWQLMRPDMLSSRALNRASISSSHGSIMFSLAFSPCLLSTLLRGGDTTECWSKEQFCIDKDPIRQNKIMRDSRNLKLWDKLFYRKYTKAFRTSTKWSNYFHKIWKKDKVTF